MRVLVCGGRNYDDPALLFWTLDRLHELHHFTLLIHGDASGADRLGAWWASLNGIKDDPYPAEWTTYGNGAGPIRNLRMIIQARPELVVAFPGRHGTANMCKQAREHGIRVISIGDHHGRRRGVGNSST